MKTLDQVEPRTIITNLPFNVSTAGSYYIVQSLPNSNGYDGLTINCGDVKIDLNGFALNGNTSDFHNGICVIGGPWDNITIRNGVIRNWGGFGINATNAMDTVITDIKAFGNGCGGIYAGQNAFLERCAAYGNGFSANSKSNDPPRDDAIQVSDFSTIKDCKVRANGGSGIHSYNHSRVIGCTAVMSQGADGIHVENYCTIKDCTVSQNKIGMTINSRCRVSENTIGYNGVVPWAGNYAGPGILIIGMNNVVERNIITWNNSGIKFSGTGNVVMNNYVSKSQSPATPWDPDFTWFVNSNFVGIIGVFTNNYGEFTNGNPWMNFKMP
jgi:parallel beta-helix repeat protein